jgi:magnesium chelatase family protein
MAVVDAIALTGLDARPVRVEAAVNPGLPQMRIVGLPDAAVREAADRIRAACHRAGFALPQSRLVVNLAPASLRKTGGGFDLPVVLALLVAAGKLKQRHVDGLVAFGELGLDGRIRATAGTLPVAAAAREVGAARIIVADQVAAEAALVEGIEVVPAATLRSAVEILRGEHPVPDVVAPPPAARRPGPDLVEVRGQPVARRALEIAAAGGHHLLLVGPPGCGKSMLARRLPGLLPALDATAALDVAAVRSVAGLRDGREPLDLSPPFRDPHHTTSVAGLIGGGSGIARPGELSLAHRGVLFLDELLETPRWILDALRQPLESGRVVLVRSGGTVAYPADVQLVAATNPCPCGHLGSPSAACRCRPDQVDRYRSRLSGPLLDRLDVQVELQPVPSDVLLGPADGEPSEVVAGRVAAARRNAADRWGTGCGNRDVSIARLRATTSTAAQKRIATGVEALGLSARAFDRCLRVARTIADLAGDDTVTVDHVDEAMAYRLAPAAVGV